MLSLGFVTRKSVYLAVCVCTLTLCASAQTQAGDATQLFFVDRSAGPALKAEDVSILDNGTAVKVLRLERADKMPIRLGIVLLSSGPSFKAQQETAVKLLGELRPNMDQAFVITRETSAGPHNWPKAQLNWESDSAALESFVRGLRWDMSLPVASAIVKQMLSLPSDKPYRNVLVEFRDPSNEAMLEWGQNPYKELEAQQQGEIADAQRFGAPVYTFALEDSYSQKVSGRLQDELSKVWRHGEQKMERLAEETGGRYFQVTGNFKSETAQIQSDLRSQYVVTFLAPHADGAAHKLECRGVRPDRIGIQKQYYPVSR